MSFDWKDYLELARKLEAMGEEEARREAALRSCVSRSYYAAFCCTRNYWSNPRTGAAAHVPQFIPRHEGTDHRDLRNYIKSERKKNSKCFDGKIEIDLDRLHQWRKQCDYDDHVDNQSMMARQSISIAEKIIRSMK